MADTLTIGCPECGKQLNVPMTAVGKKVRCKACGEVIPVSAPSAAAASKDPAKKATSPKPAAPRKKPDDMDGDGQPYGLSAPVLGARCPECATAMEEGSIICLKCGYNTKSRARARTVKTLDTTGMDVFMWLLPGILCVLLIIGVIIWDILHLLKSEDWFEKDSTLEILSSGGVKLWNVVISVFIIFFAGKFAIQRLILHPQPKEIEVH